MPLIFLVPAHICPTFSRIFLVGSTKMPCFQWGMVALHHRSGFCLPVNFTPLFIASPARLLYSTFQQVRHPLGSGWCAHHSHIRWLGSSPGGSAMRWSSECTGSPFASSSCSLAGGSTNYSVFIDMFMCKLSQIHTHICIEWSIENQTEASGGWLIHLIT